MVSTTNPIVESVMNCQQYGKLRVTVCIQKFVLGFKSFISHNHTIDNIITALDMDTAEFAWIADCQQHLMNEAKFEL